MSARNRIKGHVTLRARDLIPHELNPRTHSDAQRAALAALYEQIGFARSLLAYEVEVDGQLRLKLIDGHLRQSMDPDADVTVEVLDVSDDEARALLLSIDPLAQLAGYDAATLDVLRDTTQTDSDALANLWASIGQAAHDTAATLEKAKRPPRQEASPEKYLVIVTCKNEQHQLSLLRRFKAEQLDVKAVLS